MPEDDITAILLAAGSSTRFGSDKLLARLPNQETICSASAKAVMQVVPKLIAVIGEQQPARAILLTELGIPVHVCKHSSQGMAASLAYAVNCSKNSQGWIIALADMPFIQAGTIKSIYQALASGSVMVAPFYQNKRGHPVGFAKQFQMELTALSGDQGAQSIIKKHSVELVKLETNDPGILKDIDQVADIDSALGFERTSGKPAGPNS